MKITSSKALQDAMSSAKVLGVPATDWHFIGHKNIYEISSFLPCGRNFYFLLYLR